MRISIFCCHLVPGTNEIEALYMSEKKKTDIGLIFKSSFNYPVLCVPAMTK